jgi:phospholipid transport system substrate-binding protein
MIGSIKRLMLGVAVNLWLAQGVVYADTPMAQLQETIQQVMLTVNGTDIRSDPELREKLREALMPRFDWFEMAKQALGKHWTAIPSRQHEFVAVFTEFLGNSYIGKIGSYKDEKIVFVHESIEKNLAQVNTRIIPGKGEPTSVNYRLHRVQEEWKIYDVVVEDISVVANYRSQFNRILANGSFDDLIKRLKEKDSNHKN